MKKFILILSLLSMAFVSGFAKTPFEGKKICILGDSYVRNHRCPIEESWHYKLAFLLKMDYSNFGRNGSSIAFDRSKEGFGPAMTVRYKEMPDSADFVLVIAGHNDAGCIDKLGSWDEFKSGLEELCAGLREKYPDAKIGFITPWGVDRPYFKEVTAEIERVCKEYGFPVLNTTSPEIIDVNNPDFRKLYFQGEKDTAHLNDRGHNLMISHGQRFLDQLLNLIQ